MFGIPNAYSVTTSHFTYSAKTISHNSTDGTKITYPRLRAGGYLNSFQADNQRRPSPKKSTKHRNNNRPDPVFAGVTLISNSIRN
jgi:hypothetical protein